MASTGLRCKLVVLLCLFTLPLGTVSMSLPVQRTLGLGHSVSRIGDPRCGGWRNNTEDLKRPIREVMAEHPGIDGFCYFDQAEAWISPMPDAPDYLQMGADGASAMRNNAMAGTCPKAMKYPTGKGPLVTVTFDAGTLSTHLDCPYYVYDDLYFYSLGWLKGQRLDGSLMSNATAWEALARKECDRIQETYNFTDDEITMEKHGQSHGDKGENQYIYYKSQFTVTGNCLIASTAAIFAGGKVEHVCEPITSREFASHAYGKCLLGGNAGDAAEMAYAYSRACLLPNNMIGHESECE